MDRLGRRLGGPLGLVGAARDVRHRIHRQGGRQSRRTARSHALQVQPHPSVAGHGGRWQGPLPAPGPYDHRRRVPPQLMTDPAGTLRAAATGRKSGIRAGLTSRRLLVPRSDAYRHRAATTAFCHRSTPTPERIMSAIAESLWWQRGIIYQIYPRSFQDSNGDGIGDLPGLMERLDYLAWLGVDAIWLSPIYPSPMADFGYDVSDYTDVSPVFGTLADFDRLVAESHRRNLKVLMDLVPNHTSDQHPWFQESRSSRSSPTRDWYVWRDPGPDGGPPTNWLSEFGGSAWELDQASGQYYYH